MKHLNIMRAALTFMFAINFLLFLSPAVLSQRLDFEQVIPPIEQRSSDFEDFLVQLAWFNNPQKEIYKHDTKIAEQEVKLARKGWLEIFNVNVGLNPGAGQVDTLKNDLGEEIGLVLYPRYTIGTGINLAPLFTTPNEVKKAKEELKKIEHTENLEKLKLRAEVKERYRKYLLAVEVLKAREKLEYDAKGVYDFFSELFKNNEIEYEDYSKSFESYHNAVEARINAESDIEVAKIRIEEYIGIDFELAQRLKRR